MTQLETSFDIAAAPERVWDVLVDVERWPEWTASMKKVEPMDAGPFGKGSRARLWLRGSLGATEWEVADWTPQRTFSWKARVMPGLVTLADHELTPVADGTRVVLRITFTGPLSGVTAPMMRRISRRNLKMEAEGLKARCERL